MKPATYAPLYAALYPKLAEICREHGYALAVHGSLQRDCDLIAVPWVEAPSQPDDVLLAITQKTYAEVIGEPTMKLHNRLVYTLSLGFGECALDFSFMPAQAEGENE